MSALGPRNEGMSGCELFLGLSPQDKINNPNDWRLKCVQKTKRCAEVVLLCMLPTFSALLLFGGIAIVIDASKSDDKGPVALGGALIAMGFAGLASIAFMGVKFVRAQRKQKESLQALSQGFTTDL